MPETPRFYVWPMADERTMTLAMLLLVGLFAGAVALEFYRRHRDRRLRLEAEWRGVRDLCRDRELPEGDWKLLRAIVEQYAADSPYKAVTKRRLFDDCMVSYFRALTASARGEEVASRGVQLRDIRRQLGLDYVPLGQRIRSTRELQAGQSMWVAPAAGHDPQWRHFTVTSVDEAVFQLAPVGAEALPDYAPGATLKFRFWREDDARYVFDAPPLPVAGDPPGLKVAHVESMKRNQARAHYRVRFDESVAIGVLSAPRGEDYANLEARPVVTELRARITSLSGGGLALVFQQPVPKQVILRVRFTVPNHGERLETHVRPVGVQHLSGGRSLVRGRFVGLDEETQDVITRCVFLKQKHAAGEERL